MRSDAASGTVGQSLVASGRLLALGVRSGVAGLVSKPRKGLEAAGVSGLVRGVGFVPRAFVWKLLFSGWSCAAALLLAAGLRC